MARSQGEQVAADNNVSSTDRDEQTQSNRNRVSELAQGPTTEGQETEKQFEVEDDDDDCGMQDDNLQSSSDSKLAAVKSCRFCYGEEAPLIQPCNCKGSMAYVHGHCLG